VAPTALYALQPFNDLRCEAIFSETLPIFFLCKGVMNTRLEMISPWRAGARECGTKAALTGKSRKAKTMKGNQNNE